MNRTLSITCAATVTVMLSCSFPPSSYAGTTTLGEPLGHSPGHYPRVIVEINTTVGWPIQQAVNSWRVPVSFGRCISTVNCVRFTDVSSLGGGRVGLTTKSVFNDPSFVSIQLAKYPAMTSSQTLQTATHEFGHALGLGHDSIGVMRSPATGESTSPNSAECARVRAIYLTKP